MNPNYYTYSTVEYECKLCGWKGLGKDTLLGEGFSELFEFDCPECHENIGCISYPTIAETIKYGNAEERIEAKKRNEWMVEVEKMRLKSITQLPNIEDDSIDFTITKSDNDQDYLVVLFNRQEIWREIRTYEYFERFIEIGNLLKKKYGKKMVDLIPEGDDEYLYGDSLSSVSLIEEFRSNLKI